MSEPDEESFGSDVDEYDYSDNEDDNYDEYYSFNDDEARLSQFNNNEDPEYFSYECLSVDSVEKIFNESIETVKAKLGLSHARSKQLLHAHKWNIPEILAKYSNSPSPPTTGGTEPPGAGSTPSSEGGGVAPPTPAPPDLNNQAGAGAGGGSSDSTLILNCAVCACDLPDQDFTSPKGCGHNFCVNCWQMHFEIQINQGVSTTMSCMTVGCDNLVDEDMVLSTIMKRDLVVKYKHLSFLEYVRCHPNLRFCPGPNCPIVIKAEDCVSKSASCVMCKSRFCFKCGNSYHAPTDCETIKRWLTKCADDSETANYISANTKDCPKCNICIEKNGGCNHMQCYNCKHEFCWMCLGDWRSHGSEYYECSRYKENPNIANESAHAQAREALKKYLHYFERWENHSRSMKLEAVTLEKINNRIEDKVKASCGTWIDWQYLLDAATLLAKCRYTLQYTYPYAYYMQSSPRKQLFEYNQAQLEAEIENLSWKIEHAETTDRGDLENQMDIAEKLRTSLLKDFLET
eukprot:TRINITY_DN18340_c0_g1_i1.p1 TRINITY_DN18340_c0_g1~~TRINITY_DN18340_c0_g1_i1.p1  ORF type:complete len:516 (-),score=99.03 TRINITY_DN18340_c0_g1_i1:35-1582(-)